MQATTPPIHFEPIADYRGLVAAPVDRVAFVDIPAWRHLAVDGSGTPGDERFRSAFAALYPVAYTLHFGLKRRGVEAPLGALEGLFTLETGESFATATGPSGAMLWTLMMPVPAAADDADIDAAIAEVTRKKGPDVVAPLRVMRWTEGPSAQIMHVGPYDAERPTIRRLHQAIHAAGLVPAGTHHEIYVSDPTRTKPERLRTVIRQPVTTSPHAGTDG
jgi:hypothetical protein